MQMKANQLSPTAIEDVSLSPPVTTDTSSSKLLALTRLPPLTKPITAFWQWIALRWGIFAACACATLSCLAIYVATSDKIIVGPFSVPREYEDRGYTSEAISNAVVQFIHGNGSTVTLAQSAKASGETAAALPQDVDGDVGEDDNALENIDGRHVVSSFDQSTIADIKVPLTSFTLESLIEVLRTTLGHQPTRIAGEIVSLHQTDPAGTATLDPQQAKVLIRYKIEYPEPSFSLLGYHWWSRRITTLTDSLTANGAEEAIQKLAFITADGVEQRTVVHESVESRAGRYIARGNTYIGLQDHDRAARMYEQANSLLIKVRRRGSAHAYLSLGVIAAREGDLDEAKRLYRIAANLQGDKDDDDTAWAHLYLANLSVRQHRPAPEAIEEYQLVFRQATPKGSNQHNRQIVEAAAENNLGFLYSSLLQWKEAELRFRAAQNFASEVREAARMCVYGDAEEDACGQLLNEDQRQEAKAAALLNIDLTNHLLALSSYGLGRAKFRQQQDNAAQVERIYWQGIHADAKHAPTHYQLGILYRREHRYREAIEQFQAAIDGDRQFQPAYNAWRDLVKHWKDLRDVKDTDRPFARMLASRYKTWGDTFLQAGNPDEASDRFCIAAQMDPGYRSLCTESLR